MAKKTNKTSHVLNLITGSQPPVAPSGETQQEGSAAEEPVRVPSANVTVVDPREEGKLAEEIQKNLIRELEKEQAEQPQEQAEQPQANAGVAVQEKQEEPEQKNQQKRLSYRVVNVMEEILTPELILDALKSNDTCTCSRCQADVKALMLTRLPPKYIVADNTAVPMMLTYYCNKFRVAVLSQSIRACMKVKEHPRHIL